MKTTVIDEGEKVWIDGRRIHRVFSPSLGYILDDRFFISEERYGSLQSPSEYQVCRRVDQGFLFSLRTLDILSFLDGRGWRSNSWNEMLLESLDLSQLLRNGKGTWVSVYFAISLPRCGQADNLPSPCERAKKAERETRGRGLRWCHRTVRNHSAKSFRFFFFPSLTQL